MKEFAFIAKFDVHSENDLEAIIEYLRDTYKDYKFNAIMLKLSFKSEKRGLMKENVK